MIVIAGLGNPGPNYEDTRHNLGFLVLDRLASRLDVMSWRDKFHSRMARARLGEHDLLLLEPMTYMNDSGRAVQAALRFFRVPPSSLFVVHDELDLAFGQIRIKVGGGHAGHNGLRSIIRDIGSPQFVRLRMGIGKPPRGFRGSGADYVLSNFTSEERAELDDFVDRGVDALLMMVQRGVQRASNHFNQRPKTKKKPKEPKAQNEESDTTPNSDDQG